MVTDHNTVSEIQNSWTLKEGQIKDIKFESKNLKKGANILTGTLN